MLRVARVVLLDGKTETIPFQRVSGRTAIDANYPGCGSLKFGKEGAGPAEANALGKRGGWSGRAWQRASTQASTFVARWAAGTEGA